MTLNRSTSEGESALLTIDTNVQQFKLCDGQTKLVVTTSKCEPCNRQNNFQKFWTLQLIFEIATQVAGYSCPEEEFGFRGGDLVEVSQVFFLSMLVLELFLVFTFPFLLIYDMYVVGFFLFFFFFSMYVVGFFLVFFYSFPVYVSCQFLFCFSFSFL